MPWAYWAKPILVRGLAFEGHCGGLTHMSGYDLESLGAAG